MQKDHRQHATGRLWLRDEKVQHTRHDLFATANFLPEGMYLRELGDEIGNVFEKRHLDDIVRL
jgi:hypothetical protein